MRGDWANIDISFARSSEFGMYFEILLHHRDSPSAAGRTHDGIVSLMMYTGEMARLTARASEFSNSLKAG